jgi:hypothetical protein
VRRGLEIREARAPSDDPTHVSATTARAWRCVVCSLAQRMSLASGRRMLRAQVADGSSARCALSLAVRCAKLWEPGRGCGRGTCAHGARGSFHPLSRKKIRRIPQIRGVLRTRASARGIGAPSIVARPRGQVSETSWTGIRPLAHASAHCSGRGRSSAHRASASHTGTRALSSAASCAPGCDLAPTHAPVVSSPWEHAPACRASASRSRRRPAGASRGVGKLRGS